MLAHALASIVAHTDAAVEVLVVDSASDGPETAEVAARAGVRWVRADRKGLSIARNVGLTHASGDVVIYTDDDCEAGPDWCAPLLTPFGDWRVGATSGSMLDAGEPLDFDRPGRRFNRTIDGLDAGHGAIMAFDRRAALELGGFDELLGAGSSLPGAEDLDMFCRFLRAGWLVAYEPAAYVRHLNQRLNAEHAELLRGYGLGLGAMAAKFCRVDRVLGVHMLLLVGYRAGADALRRTIGRHEAAASYWALVRGFVGGVAVGVRLPMDGDLFSGAPVDRAERARRRDRPPDGRAGRAVRSAGRPGPALMRWRRGRRGPRADRRTSPVVIPLSTVDERYLASSIAWQAFRPTATAIVANPARTADGAIDLEPVRRLGVLLVANFPRLTQRIRLAPLGLHAPVWTDDPTFDLDWHIRRHPGVVDADAIPGRLLGGFENGPMSRHRGPWDFLVADLSDGNMLLVMRIHHVAVDGLVGRALFLGLTDEGRRRQHGAEWPALPARGPSPKSELGIAWALLRRFRAEKCDSGGLRALWTGWRAIPLRDRLRRVVGRNLRPVRNFWLSRRGRDRLPVEPRRVSVPLAPIRRLARTHSASLGDATTAALVVAISSLRAGKEPIRVMVPVAVRGGATEKQANRVKIVVLQLPHSTDLTEVLEATVGQMAAVAGGLTSPGAPAAAGSSGHRPGDWQAYSTFLPGPRRSVTMMERPVVEMMLWPAMDPREQCAALSLSVVDQLTIGLTAGPGVDADALAAAMRQAFLEQAGAAG